MNELADTQSPAPGDAARPQPHARRGVSGVALCVPEGAYTAMAPSRLTDSAPATGESAQYGQSAWRATSSVDGRLRSDDLVWAGVAPKGGSARRTRLSLE